ncbi:hypothetical protein ACTFIY_004529 [Dictyostelium cf. discoideum]
MKLGCSLLHKTFSSKIYTKSTVVSNSTSINRLSTLYLAASTPNFSQAQINVFQVITSPLIFDQTKKVKSEDYCYTFECIITITKFNLWKLYCFLCASLTVGYSRIYSSDGLSVRDSISSSSSSSSSSGSGSSSSSRSSNIQDAQSINVNHSWSFEDVLLEEISIGSKSFPRGLKVDLSAVNSTEFI